MPRKEPFFVRVKKRVKKAKKSYIRFFYANMRLDEALDAFKQRKIQLENLKELLSRCEISYTATDRIAPVNPPTRESYISIKPPPTFEKISGQKLQQILDAIKHLHQCERFIAKMNLRTRRHGILVPKKYRHLMEGFYSDFWWPHVRLTRIDEEVFEHELERRKAAQKK